MRGLVAGLLGLGMLGGCGSSPGVQFIGGSPFITGDRDCARYSPGSSNGTIQCMRSDSSPTGMRRALTEQELGYVMAQQQIQEQQLQSLNQSVQQVGRSMQAPSYGAYV